MDNIFSFLKCKVPILLLLAMSSFATSPASLWAEFQADANAFREKHSSSKITVSAIVAETYISIYLTPVVSLVDKIGEEAKVICVLPRTESGKLSSFKQGSKITMTGNFYAAREDKIVIKQCQAEGSN